ncbi:dTDP-4-dehydrorhamnose reductase [Candidatus Uhrbacteria bacterium]|nr:dTDP-4-dehydrorhamnose reductase [Candidatus Uhrbacteria bacterium]
MRVFILGGHGMLGGYLADTFSFAEVRQWGRSECDCTDADAVHAALETVRPDIVINAAAYTAVDRAEEEPDRADAINATAVAILANASAAVGATFVHCSTDYVFPGTSAVGWCEDDAPQPINAYGRSKARGEEQVRMIAAAHPAWSWYIVRTSRLFGRAGTSPSAKQSFLETILARARSQDRLEVVHAEMAAPTYAADLATAMLDLVRTRAASGIYHRTNDGGCTWYEFAAAALREVAWKGTLVPVPSRAYPRPARRPAYSVLKSTKLPPLRSWETALHAYLAHRSL